MLLTQQLLSTIRPPSLVTLGTARCTGIWGQGGGNEWLLLVGPVSDNCLPPWQGLSKWGSAGSKWNRLWWSLLDPPEENGSSSPILLCGIFSPTSSSSLLSSLSPLFSSSSLPPPLLSSHQLQMFLLTVLETFPRFEEAFLFSWFILTKVRHSKGNLVSKDTRHKWGINL